MEDIIRRLALENAVKYGGQANPKAIVGSLIKEFPDAKNDMQGAMQLINKIVSELNGLAVNEQKAKLLQLNPEYEQEQQAKKQERKEKAGELPELPNAEMGKVVTRIAPGPSKFNHLGHAMSFLINYLYAKKYEGKVIFRFEDTNPDADAQLYVDAMQEDCFNYLGIKPDETIFASDDIPKFYEYVEKLLNENHAYVSDDTSEEIALQRREMKPSKNREKTVKENLSLWFDMKEGKIKDFTVRLKIDHAHKNAVMRDPVIMRSNTTEHYRQKNKFNVWPMFDFENPVEEGLTGVTHAMRSNEFDSRIELHNYVAKLLNFPEVLYKHYGRYNVVGATTQGREIRALIESGDFIGWDDPRLVTLRALKRRGIVKEAYYELAKKIGFSKTQTNLDYSVIAAVNRSLLDESAYRFFAVVDPIEIAVAGIPEDIKEFSLSYHPHKEKGERKLAVTEKYYIEKKDNQEIPIGQTVRFMDAMNIKKISEDEFVFVSQSYEDFLALGNDEKAGLIHFVPKDGNEVLAEIFMPDTKTLPVICEPNIDKINVGDVIQFERFAFCRLDTKEENKKPIFWFTHE
ncbi:glutamate--tRNA ligase [Candidatus Woesearchaeota archaeon]|nr:glutamate--tRNA ligase [Candidatus Woesearchaeota archaeon]